MKWIIQDWTGDRKFPDHTFDTFEDAIAFLEEQFPNEVDREEFYIEQEVESEEV